MNDLNHDQHSPRLEVYNTIILAIATLCAAWCSYQSSLWGGIQTFRLADSNKYARLAQQTSIQASQKMTMEEVAIVSFMDAVLDQNKKRSDYILKGLRPELSKILFDWMQLDPANDSTAPRNPMTTPGYQDLMKRRTDESEKLSTRSAEAYNEGNRANGISDTYGLFTVIFSMVMFLGAIATKIIRLRLRFILIIVSALICAAALFLVIFSMPIAHKGSFT